MSHWPLNVSNFSKTDKLKICSFFVESNFWTQADKVLEFERSFAKYTGTKNSLFVSSGSAANTILAMYLKDTCEKKKVIFPSTTWITSVSPFVREGFDPVFVDVNLHDFSIDLNKLEEILQQQAEEIACVFFTSLLGYTPDIGKIKDLCGKYKVKVMMDNCENTFGLYDNQNISSFFTSTTSTYFGHQIQSVEGGFIFTNDDDVYEYGLMARNHGMTRSLGNIAYKYRNPLVDPKFEFQILGNNFRNTNINAYIGTLDFQRIKEYEEKRIVNYIHFSENLDLDKFYLPPIREKCVDYPFALPIICKTKESKVKALRLCDSLKIESRPIISGNLLRQNAFRKYAIYQKFKNSELLNENGFYVGSHNQVKQSQIENFCQGLNNI
jgi:CDP-6-deoxy-D-xylo-4-hexulose-3-dehydrase